MKHPRQKSNTPIIPDWIKIPKLGIGGDALVPGSGVGDAESGSGVGGSALGVGIGGAAPFPSLLSPGSVPSTQVDGKIDVELLKCSKGNKD